MDSVLKTVVKTGTATKSINPVFYYNPSPTPVQTACFLVILAISGGWNCILRGLVTGINLHIGIDFNGIQVTRPWVCILFLY